LPLERGINDGNRDINAHGEIYLSENKINIK